MYRSSFLKKTIWTFGTSLAAATLWAGLWASLGAGLVGETGCRNSLNAAPPPDWPPLLSNASTFTDQGPIDQDMVLRGLLAMDINNRSDLEKTTLAMYTQGDPSFRQYLTLDDFDQKYGPTEADVSAVVAFLQKNGLTVERTSTRALLIEFSGSAELIDAAFGFVIHLFHKTSAMPNDTTDDTFNPVPSPVAPAGLPATVQGIVGLTVSFPTSPGPEHVPTLSMAMPTNVKTSLTPPQYGSYYGYAAAAAAGFTGKGSSIGVVTGFAYHDADATSFWDAWRIDRDPATDIDVVAENTGDAITGYGDEATTDVQWASSMAPGADIRVYEMPDNDELSTLWGFHEAIGRNEVDVVTDSFAHGETNTSPLLGRSFDDAALMGAALGITVVAASGDSNSVDLPGSSSWVTSVGGTAASLDSSGNITGEQGWTNSGCGSSDDYDRPSWQPAVLTPNDDGREVCDLSMNGAATSWVVQKGVWQQYGGTSIAGPLVAAAVAITNGARAAAGKPRLGWLNKRLYESTNIQAALNDITTSGSTKYPGLPGWDCTTGWGTINVPKFLAADW